MITTIIKDYVREYNTNELTLLIISSLVLSYIFTKNFPIFSDTFISALIASYSIFIGFLFNLIIMLSNMAKDITCINNEPKSRIDMKQMKLNVIERGLKIISGSILIAVANIILMLINILYSNNHTQIIIMKHNITTVTSYLLIGLTYIFIILFIDSLYKILKIAHIILQKDIQTKRKELQNY